MTTIEQELIWTKDALAYAKAVIGSYRKDIASILSIEYVNAGIVYKDAFCEGSIYQEALQTINKIARGELKPRYYNENPAMMDLSKE